MGSTSGNVEVEVDGLYRTGRQVADAAEPAHTAGRSLGNVLESGNSGHPLIGSALSNFAGGHVTPHAARLHPEIMGGSHRVGNVAAVAREGRASQVQVARPREE